VDQSTEEGLIGATTYLITWVHRRWLAWRWLWRASAMQRACDSHDYPAEIAAIRSKQEAITAKIDNAASYEAALGYVRESIALDHRISELLKTMNECGAGQGPIL